MTLAQWVASARRGQRFTYYRGFLLADIEDNFTAAQCAHSARQFYETGRCLLVQQRHGPEDYSYMAVRL